MRSPSFPLAGGAATLPVAAVDGTSRPATGPAAAKRRGHGTRASAPGGSWLARLDAWFARQGERDRDAWLAGAKDAFELEARIRDLGRNTPARYY
jgi:hypothetical protein